MSPDSGRGDGFCEQTRTPGVGQSLVPASFDELALVHDEGSVAEMGGLQLMRHHARDAELVPLATLTRELDGGAGWAQAGD